MKELVMKKWVKALRSGKYKQFKGGLKGKTEEGKLGYCCLGVLCRVVGSPTLSRLGADLPRDIVCEKAGLSNWNPEVNYLDTGRRFLSSLNDEGITFKEIADLIEKQWKKL
jgi:hypothetical protein